MFSGTVYLAADHGGFAHKEYLKQKLQGLNIAVEDCGALTLDPNDDYPDFVRVAAEKVSQDSTSRGIVLGRTGEGEAMCANRVKGVRAAVYNSVQLDLIVRAREHNDANVLSLGADFVSDADAWEAVVLWLNTDFPQDERHVRRIKKLDE